MTFVAAAVAAQDAEDALLMPPGAPGVSGKAAILASFTQDIAGSKADGVVFAIDRKTDVGVSGNMGWKWAAISRGPARRPGVASGARFAQCRRT